MGIEDIIQYTQKTPENTNPNILRSMLNSLLKENTGDFTTCELTYVNNAEDSYNLIVANIDAEDPVQTQGSIFSSGFGDSQTVHVILYKGVAWASFQEGNLPPDSDISVSGDIEYNAESDYFLITGDGTITIDY